MRHSDSERDPVERLAEEFAARRRAGDAVSAEEYAERHPELAAEILSLFPAIAMMERLSHREQAERKFDRRTGPLAIRRSDSLGDFRIIREIGRGGMGIVFEAEQKSLKRKVALKVLGPSVSGSPADLQRFRREAEAAAKLHHTNIVPVFGVGEHDGLHFYAMQLIEGAPLSEVIHQARGRLDPTVADASTDVSADRLAIVAWERNDWKRIAQAVAQAADALDYAHRHGVLHRDIKPSNLLLDRDGAIWVADFGLAKHENQAGGSSTSHLIGTLRYMAPEQFGGQTDARGDIYGLGLTLFELLTLRPAYEETRHGPLVLQKTSEAIPSPRSIVRGIPRDLETIVLKACAIRPDDRYSRAGAMADDLRRFAEDRPILARRATPLERLQRWSRRNPAIASLLAITMILLMTIAVMATLSYRRSELTLRQTRQDNLRATLAAQQAQRESRRAEDNLRLAIRAFDDIMNDLSSRGAPRSLDLEINPDDPIAVPPIATPADAELLRRLLSFFEEFAKQNSSSQLIEELARSHQRIGDLYQRLGELDAAESAYREALLDFDALAKQGGDPLKTVILQSRTLNDLGIVTSLRGDAWGAVSRHEQARDRLESEAAAMSSEEGRFELAKTLILLGSVHTRSGSRTRDEAGPGRMGPPPWVHRDGSPHPPELLGRPPRRHSPNSPNSPLRPPPRRSPEQLSRIFEQALELLNGLVAAHPNHPEYRLSLARCYRNGSSCARLFGNHQEANEMALKGTRILETLAADFPNAPIYPHELAEMLCMTPEETAPPLRNPEFEARLDRAVVICDRLTSIHPHVLEYQALKAAALSKLGLKRYEDGDRDRAETTLRRALATLTLIPERFRALPRSAMTHARSYRGLALVKAASGRRDEAAKLLDKGIAALNRSLEIHQESPPVRDYVLILERQKDQLASSATERP